MRYFDIPGMEHDHLRDNEGPGKFQRGLVRFGGALIVGVAVEAITAVPIAGIASAALVATTDLPNFQRRPH